MKSSSLARLAAWFVSVSSHSSHLIEAELLATKMQSKARIVHAPETVTQSATDNLPFVLFAAGATAIGGFLFGYGAAHSPSGRFRIGEFCAQHAADCARETR